MNELLNAKAEILSELEKLKAVNLTEQIAEKVAAKKAELDATLEEFKAETEQSALSEHTASISELEIGLKYIERAIARAEAVQADEPEEVVDATELAEV